MSNLKGSKTEQNLKDAFAGESMANRRYLYFAQQADIEGLPEIAGNFSPLRARGRLRRDRRLVRDPGQGRTLAREPLHQGTGRHGLRNRRTRLSSRQQPG